MCQPVGQAHEIERHRDHELLQMYFGRAHIACSAQPHQPGALRKGALHARPPVLQGLPLGLLLLGTQAHQSRVVGLDPDGQLAGSPI